MFPQAAMSSRLELLTVCFSIVEARVGVSMLEAHGLIVLAPMEFVTVSPDYMIACGGIPVWVAGGDLADARELLAVVKAEPMESPPRRWRALEAVAGVIILSHGVPPMPTPPDGRSQLKYTGPLAALLLGSGLLLFDGQLLGILVPLVEMVQGYR